VVILSGAASHYHSNLFVVFVVRILRSRALVFAKVKWRGWGGLFGSDGIHDMVFDYMTLLISERCLLMIQ